MHFDDKHPQTDNNHNDLDIAKRLEWLDFKAIDEILVKSCDELVSSHIDDLMEDLYSHFLASEETAAFFSSREILERARSAQGRYFARLTKGDYDQQYVRERWQIGATHHRIQLDPKWYLGAYCKALIFMQSLLMQNKSLTDCKQVLPALTKIIFFDMSLAIDTYIMSKEQALRQQRDSIRELETEKRTTKNLLELAPLGLIRLDKNLTLLDCNLEFLRYLDLQKREEALGKSLIDLAPHLPTERFLASLHQGEPYQSQAEPLNFKSTATHERAFFDWAVWPVKSEDEPSQGIVAMFANCTDRVRLQQQREDFVATLTHDLKTPILAANRALMLLMEGDFGEVTAAQSEILKTIHQSNNALYELVLTLLDVYRFDSGAKQLSMGPIDVAELVERLCIELQPLASAKNIAFFFYKAERTEIIMADGDEIRRVIQNLVDNSLKFTPQGGKITISIAFDENDAILKVSDTGKGISQEDMPRLFERFWQSTSGGRYYASTGLGLFLCHKIVEMHGGKISCESKPGMGSTFEVRLPKIIL